MQCFWKMENACPHKTPPQRMFLSGMQVSEISEIIVLFFLIKKLHNQRTTYVLLVILVNEFTDHLFLKMEV